MSHGSIMAGPKESASARGVQMRYIIIFPGPRDF